MSIVSSLISTVGAVVCCGFLFKLINIIVKLFFTPPTNWSKYGAKKGSWALVTGSTDGIGKEFAFQLAKKGFNIMLVARNKDKLQTTKDQVLKECRSTVEVETVQFNFAESGKFEMLADALRGKNILVLINNVGVSHDHPEYFEETSFQSLETMVNVNVLNTIRITRLLLPRMLDQKTGLILNIGSFSGETPIPLLQTYSASKAFLKTWSLSLAAEVWEKGVEVQLLNTYFVVSNMSKYRRPNIFVPTPKAYVQAAMRCAGQSDFITPYPSHALIKVAMDLVPSWALTVYNKGLMRKTRARALAKATAAGKAA